ncbi:MAG: NAD-dependent protein deacylase [Defluviitaleaceae bacterium]|nr:NAD-dependent protein deacylase [Defluviitaleaceae bacterium]
MEEPIKLLKSLVKDSKNIVFFGGAGVSTESGIPDFRSIDGLYHQTYKYPPEIMLSHTFFKSNTKDFYNFYKNKMVNMDVKPNQAHIALSKLESQGKLKAVITQNIDGLHQMAGSKNVLELHGSVYRNHCMQCTKFYHVDIIHAHDIPTCECGGVIKPDVVLYEESLNHDILTQAIKLVSQADMLMVGGTSLSVYPAASLVNHYNGDKLVLINNSKTPYDNQANLRIHNNIGHVLSMI